MNIVIVGGGTAGYLSALYFNKSFPNYNITVIDSSKIGILGAGEGTSANFGQALRDLNIDIDEFVYRTNATPKNGVIFAKWNKDNHEYINPFFDNFNKEPYMNDPEKMLKVMSYSILKNKNMDDIILMASLAKKDLFIPEICAWHLDARLLAKFFSEIALSRGIKIIDDVAISFNENSLGEISSIVLENQTLDCDFVVDCSGFQRLIIGKHYNSKWEDLTDTLPCDEAIAFFMPKNDLVTYSRAEAMDFGWSWKVPLQHRYGCGYVYDSKYINYDQALDEIYSKFGNNVEIIKHFKYKSGYYKEPWIKNSIAIGLSSGFFEPIEATSISMTITMIKLFIEKFFILYKPNTSINKTYNKIVSNLNDEIASFIYLHYVTNRTDTAFWNDFVMINKIPEKTKMFLDNAQKTIIPLKDHMNPKVPFNWQTWLVVYLNKDIKNMDSILLDVDKDTELLYNEIVEKVNSYKESALSINEYIEKIKKKKGETHERN
jgi:tryptophan halogenase